MKTFICALCNKNVTTGNGNKGKVCSVCRNTYKYRKYKEEAVKYKGGKCSKCGFSETLSALEFHHTNPNEKEFGISKHMRPLDSIKEELDKCILLCANCHRELHCCEEKFEKILNFFQKTS